MSARRGPPSEAHQIDDAEQRLGVALPAVLREMYLAGDDRYNGDGQWWVIWPLSQLVQENLHWWQVGMLDRSFLAFGDDGMGAFFCVRITDHAGIVRWNDIDHDVDREWSSLDQFMREWVEDIRSSPGLCSARFTTARSR